MSVSKHLHSPVRVRVVMFGPVRFGHASVRVHLRLRTITTDCISPRHLLCCFSTLISNLFSFWVQFPIKLLGLLRQICLRGCSSMCSHFTLCLSRVCRLNEQIANNESNTLVRSGTPLQQQECATRVTKAISRRGQSVCVQL